ncbi:MULTISPECIES: DUF2793 domain-containing protein [Hyphomonas]|uniref:Sulfotransferase domain-containing protein n=1 Tax=Hyphomonas adhaerens TaxID=81029 RepID=A0A3B9H3R1_9PROT|nr:MULTISPECIES: DUF2793 domain-containing protein [Hyphomonas]MBB42112.1 hypothetical protein [Hyphomonas sp.]HAE29331.1 hypothetical protein [Hyphomonas adhaerens]|tara:strand:- start:18069 stop:18809 length:741 start_codon:yes stop_codon:yes gene_type:complete
MDTSPRLAMPYLLPNQAQKHVTHNEALRRLDTMVQLSVANRDLTAPPASPGEGECWLVAAGATGDWAGHETEIAAWQDGGRVDGADLELVYLERDPRDVMASLFHQVTGRFRDFFNYQGSISDFIRDPYFGASSLARFRGMWDEILSERPFLKITYEDVHQNPEAVIRTILKYYNIDLDEAAVEYGIEAGRIDNMRVVELSESDKEPWLRPRNGSTKVRCGIVGGYLTEFNETDIKYLNSVFESKM